jgi:ABC-type glycerol-3-phosphate transport system permease component
VGTRSGERGGTPMVCAIRLDGGCVAAPGRAARYIASLTPAGPFGLGNFVEAWASGNFPLWYLNTVLMCGGILAVQLVTISMAGYSFARLR